jgi:photosystem II stability/assembly factor-like uncharacterized protein
MDELERNELERAGRALRDSVTPENEPSDRVRARARGIVRRRRVFTVGSIATALIVALVAIVLVANGGNEVGVHTIGPAASDTTNGVPTSATVSLSSRQVDEVQGMSSMAFADASHGWRVDPLTGLKLERTTDGGRTWVAQIAVPDGNRVSGVVAVDANNAFALIADGSDPRTRLMRTTNGSIWQQTVGSERLSAPLELVSFADFRHGWGLTRFGDLVTTADAGGHWSAMAQPNPGRGADRLLVGSVCRTGARSGWAATADSVYRSDDNGATWRRQVTLPVAGGSTTSLECSGAHAAYASYNHGAGQSIGGFLRTDDGGAHWRVLTEDRAGGGTPVTGPGFPSLQTRGDPSSMTADGVLVFVTGCEVCQPNRNWVVIGTAQDRYVEGLFDGDPANNRNTLAAQAVDARHVFAEVQTIPLSGTGPRPVSLYASTDGGQTWHVRSKNS